MFLMRKTTFFEKIERRTYRKSKKCFVVQVATFALSKDSWRAELFWRKPLRSVLQDCWSSRVTSQRFLWNPLKPFAIFMVGRWFMFFNKYLVKPAQKMAGENECSVVLVKQLFTLSKQNPNKFINLNIFESNTKSLMLRHIFWQNGALQAKAYLENSTFSRK